MSNTSQAGKGDRPRNNFSQQYRDNFDSIDWGNRSKTVNSTSTGSISGYNPVETYDQNNISLNRDEY